MFCNLLNKIFPNKKIFLGAVIIIKNEAQYMREWLEFHKIVGVEKFFIYDNESTDNIRDVLSPYIESGIVEYIYWPGKKQQMSVYNHALKKFGSQCEWLMFIDADEFMVPVETSDIKTEIKKIIKNDSRVGNILCPWVMYGTNGHETKPDGLVIENFTAHRPFKRYGHKSIVNPSKAKIIKSPHQAVLKRKYHMIDESGKVYSDDWLQHQWESDVILPYDKIRVNHYYTKSVEEYYIRHSFGCADADQDSRSEEELKEIMSDANLQDDIMDKYVKLVYSAIKGKK